MMYFSMAKEILFKATSILSSGELNILINFGRRHHEEHFCEIILNLEQWFERK